jgi:hypothetical protein
MRQLAASGTRFLAAVALALALGTGEASANHIYQLSGVTFDDGGTATGTFTTDDGITAFLAWDITTSTVGGHVGFEFTNFTSSSNNDGMPNSILILGNASSVNELVLTFTGGLIATGATLTPGAGQSFEGTVGGTRNVTSGSVVAAAAVPEPSSFVLAGIAALAGLGAWVMRRRTSWPATSA